MENLWPEQFDENTKTSAKSLLAEQAILLGKITKGIVYAEVSDLEKFSAISQSMENDFSFRFDIFGKFLDGYRFHVLSFSHDITLYPVKFQLDEKIAEELGVKKSYQGYVHDIKTPDELKIFVAKILVSKRIKDVVGSIIRLSK